jgi:hypothetical protein
MGGNAVAAAAPLWIVEFGTCNTTPRCVRANANSAPPETCANTGSSGPVGTWFANFTDYLAQARLLMGVLATERHAVDWRPDWRPESRPTRVLRAARHELGQAAANRRRPRLRASVDDQPFGNDVSGRWLHQSCAFARGALDRRGRHPLGRLDFTEGRLSTAGIGQRGVQNGRDRHRCAVLSGGSNGDRHRDDRLRGSAAHRLGASNRRPRTYCDDPRESRSRLGRRQVFRGSDPRPQRSVLIPRRARR